MPDSNVKKVKPGVERRHGIADRRMGGERRSMARMQMEKDCRTYVPRRRTDVEAEIMQNDWWSDIRSMF